MDSIKKTIRAILKEMFIQEATMYDDGKNIPTTIRQWVKSKLGSDVSKYKIIQSESEVVINTPWHQSDYETYQFFKLEDNNSATLVGNVITRSGMESDSPQGFQDGQSKTGKVTVPEGFVLVCIGTYPKRAEIYTGQNVQSFLPDKTKSLELGPSELIILQAAKSLKSHARPKFHDKYYDTLISQGLLKSNRSITVDGMNLLLDPEIQEKVRQAAELFRQKTGRYFSY